MMARSAEIWSRSPMASSNPRIWSSSVTPCSKVEFLISRFSSSATTSEREPLNLMKLRMVLTWVLLSFNSSRLTLVCSGVTFSA